MLNVSERTGSNVKTTNAMESNGIVPTIVMNPRVTRRLQGESGIMGEDDDLAIVALSDPLSYMRRFSCE